MHTRSSLRQHERNARESTPPCICVYIYMCTYIQTTNLKTYAGKRTTAQAGIACKCIYVYINIHTHTHAGVDDDNTEMRGKIHHRLTDHSNVSPPAEEQGRGEGGGGAPSPLVPRLQLKRCVSDDAGKISQKSERCPIACTIRLLSWRFENLCPMIWSLRCAQILERQLVTHFAMCTDHEADFWEIIVVPVPSSLRCATVVVGTRLFLCPKGRDGMCD